MTGRRLIFAGRPGVGKGTFAKIISKELNLFHLSPGELIRREISRATPNGKELKGYVEKGQLVPDDFICKLVGEVLQASKGYNGFILDGFPRSLNQCLAIDRLAQIDRLVELKLERSIAVEKMLARRHCSACGVVLRCLIRLLSIFLFV